MMTLDESQQIEDLLVIWYRYDRSYMPNLGAPRVCPSSRGYSSGDVHEDAEDRDDDLDRIKAQAIAKCVDELHYLHRAAIGVHMRNRMAGISVHRNPRIEDQHTAYQAAKSQLLPKLIWCGLIKYESA